MAYSTIDNPALHFQTKIYTGDGNDDRNIVFDVTDTSMQPDFLWSARRDSGDNYSMYDSVRGAGKEMRNAETGAEYSRSDNIQALQSNGFQVGTDSQVNADGGTYVSWAWKAGGSASNNTDGTVTVSLSVNTTAGFSVGTYTGTSANNTFGHGLGAIPDWLMIKNRSSGSRKWALWHKNLTGTNKYLAIDRDDGEQTDTATWQNTAHTNTVFASGGSGEVNQGSENFICYAWTSIKGFSKFGSYKGNGNADGPMIYTGFKPAWIMTKQIDGSSSYILHDNKRDPINPIDEFFTMEVAEAAGDLDSFDLLSNGFKVRTSNGDRNSDTNTFVYWAFAESPIVNSNGIPNNAR